MARRVLLPGRMKAEILVGGTWLECRLIQQGFAWQAWVEVAVIGEGEPRYEPAMMVVPHGAAMRLAGEVRC